MTDDNQWVTASDLQSRLAKDAEFKAIQAERAQRNAEYYRRLGEDARPFEEALRSVDPRFRRMDSLTAPKERLSSVVVALLLEWLPRLKENRNKEMLIRGLIAAKEPFDGQPLVDCFMADSLEESLRFPIANTMAYAKVTGINDWLVEAVQVKRYGTSRAMLAEAVAKHVPRKLAREVLLKLLDDIPGPAASGLARFGGFEELQAIKARVESATGWQKKDMERAIRKIEDRLEKQSNRKK